MSHSFTLFIVLTAVIGFFIDEISSQVKKSWDSLLIRHVGLMIFIGFFGFTYQDSLKNGLECLLAYCKLIAFFIVPYIPFFQSKILIAFALLHFLLSLVTVVGFCLLYYFLMRRNYLSSINMLWALWFIIGSLFLVG